MKFKGAKGKTAGWTKQPTGKKGPAPQLDRQPRQTLNTDTSTLPQASWP